jgi:hypothetical protein
MAAIGAGVLGLLCLSSSVYASMMGGKEEKPAATTPAATTPATATVVSKDVKGRYVRLWQGEPYQNQDAYALNILELEVYDSSGTNIAQGKTATARSQYTGDHQAVMAFDGSLDTKYRSNYDDKEDWLEVDLGSVIDIHKIVIIHPGSEDVYEGVAMKDGLRGYIEIFDDDGKVVKTSQIEETSTDHVYTYNFKERGGGNWRGGQGILKTRADLIAEKQAADAAADEAEQKRLASVAVEKAAADKAAVEKAAADKAAADKALLDEQAANRARFLSEAADRAAEGNRIASEAAEANRIASLKASMVDYETVACEAGTDPRNDPNNKWEWGNDDKIRLYPNPKIADSWVSDWRTNYKTINCTGLVDGGDNVMNAVDGFFESCDDLGGGVIVRHESGKNLGDCRNECASNGNCLGFIHKADVGFCQLHDNRDPYGVDVCGQGYTVHRK